MARPCICRLGLVKRRTLCNHRIVCECAKRKAFLWYFFMLTEAQAEVCCKLCAVLHLCTDFRYPHIISLVYFTFLIRAICKRNRERDRIHANWMIWQGRGESTINALTVLIGLCCGWWYCLGVEWIISNANSYVWLLCVIYGGRHYIDAKRHYQWMSIAWEWNLMALQKINRRQNISFHMFIYIYYYFLLRNQICETILTTTS